MSYLAGLWSGLSPISVDNSQPEEASDVISGVIVEPTSMDISVKFGDSRSNRSGDIWLPHFVTDERWMSERWQSYAGHHIRPTGIWPINYNFVMVVIGDGGHWQALNANANAFHNENKEFFYPSYPGKKLRNRNTIFVKKLTISLFLFLVVPCLWGWKPKRYTVNLIDSAIWDKLFYS